MERNPYDYSHRQGVLPISWEDFHGICKGLALAVSAYQPEIILAVGRGGFYPGTLVAHILQVEIYPVRLTRRLNDVVIRKRPKWLVQPPRAIKGRRVLVVDDDPARSSVTLRFDSLRLSLVPGSEASDDIPKVEKRMRGPEVLEVARYPEIVFASTSVRSQAKDGSHLRIVVAGTLTLRGRSFPVEVPLEVVRETHGIVARGALVLNLRDIGIEPPSVAGVVNVANRFQLEFEIRARAAAQP